MTTGRDALRTLDTAIVSARDDLNAAHAACATRAAALATLERKQASIYRALAELRLDLIRSDATISALDEAERRAKSLLEDHARAIEALQRDTHAAEAAIVSLEAERRATELRRDEAANALEDQRTETRARLANDPSYKSALAAADEADRVAERAAQKLDLAKTDRDEKGAPYRNDPLFSYLWDREWSTPGYRAGGITRLLDGWVARLCGYEAARLNYGRLIELPDRLAEHLQRVEDSAHAADEAVSALARAALAADGADALESALAEAEAALGKIDARLEAAEAAHAKTAAALSAALAGEDGPYAQARALLTNAFAARDVPDLRVLAAETTTRDDDALVDALISVRRSVLELEVNERQTLDSPQRYAELLERLEGVRRRFKSAGYDDPDSVFTSAAALRLLLEQFRRGVLSSDNLWREIEKAHRRARGSPRGRGAGWGDDLLDDLSPELNDILGDVMGDVMGGGFGGQRGGGRSSRQGPWGAPPPPRTRPRPPRAPRSMGRSGGGGGFKTGGGF